MGTKTRQAQKERKPASGIAAGFNKGFKTTTRARPIQKNVRRGAQHPRLRAVKAIINDLVGFSPLEKRVQELLRIGKEKRALKIAKKRLGSMKAAKKKRTKMEDAIRAATTAKKK